MKNVCFSKKKPYFCILNNIKTRNMEKQPLNRIKVMLAERMLTNKQLAEMLGKDPATISKWVTNTSQPTLENLIEIARCLKCDMNDLVRLDDVVTIKTDK
jgi:DNA-binding Xre family transcriptional regulator